MKYDSIFSSESGENYGDFLRCEIVVASQVSLVRFAGLEFLPLVNHCYILGPPIFGMTQTVARVDRTTASFFDGNSSLRRVRHRRFLLYELLTLSSSSL